MFYPIYPQGLIDEFCAEFERENPLNLFTGILEQTGKRFNPKLGGNCFMLSKLFRDQIVAKFDGLQAKIISSPSPLHHQAVVLTQDTQSIYFYDPTLLLGHTVNVNGFLEQKQKAAVFSGYPQTGAKSATVKFTLNTEGTRLTISRATFDAEKNNSIVSNSLWAFRLSELADIDYSNAHRQPVFDPKMSFERKKLFFRLLREDGSTSHILFDAEQGQTVVYSEGERALFNTRDAQILINGIAKEMEVKPSDIVHSINSAVVLLRAYQSRK
jgi:hypothetical protein